MKNESEDIVYMNAGLGERWKLNEENIYVMEFGEVESSFSDEKQNLLFHIEDFSWWFQYRAIVVEKVADRYFGKGHMIFDIGGGNGFTTCYLKKKGYKMALIEPSYQACVNARKRRGGVETIFCGIVDEDSVPDYSISECMILDVLEHIEQDKKYLKLLYKKLQRGGRILITVPAFPILWSSEDKADGHFRRYRKEELRRLAENAGFSVLYLNYFFEFLFFPVLIVRVGCEKIGLLKRREDRSEGERVKIMKKQFRKQTGLIGVVLRKIEQIECRRIEKGKKIRFGSSVVCVLEKR